MKIKNKYYTAYTLIEIIIVISVIGILASIMALSFSSWQKTTYENNVKSDAINAASAMESARNFEASGYPASISSVFTPSKYVTVSGGSSDGGKTFCVDLGYLKDATIQYFIDSASAKKDAQPGTCSSRSGQLFAPTNAAASTVSTSSINISFDMVPGATGYILQRSNTAAFTSALTIANFGVSPALPYTSTSLAENTKYYYRVQALKAAGDIVSDWSNIASAMTSDSSVAVPIAPIVSQSTVGGVTTYSWTDLSSVCIAGNSSSYRAAYEYHYEITPTGYDSGWRAVGDANTSQKLTLTTSSVDKIYKLSVRARCFNVDRTSNWGVEGNNVYVRVGAPAAPATTVAYSNPNVQATITPVTCSFGTASYAFANRTNDGIWGAYSAWSTNLTASQAAGQGIKYGYKAEAECVYDSGSYGVFASVASAQSSEATYIHPINTPAAPVVTYANAGATTTWSWAAVTCAAGTTANYRYDYTIAPTGYDSGWVNNGASTAVAFTTSTVGQIYTISVQSNCTNSNATSGWSGSGSATYTSPMPPSVASCGASSITATTAILCANVTSAGDASITDSGICWSTTPNPVTNCMGEYSTALTFSTNNTGSNNGMQSIAVSPDGISVYAAYQSNSSYAGGVAVYNRNTSTGALTFSTNNTGSNNGMQSIAVSPDGKSVYAGYQSSSLFAGGVAVYSRNTSTGALTFSGNITNSNNGMQSITVSPDGKSVYAGYQSNSSYAGGVAVYNRNVTTGALTFSTNNAGSNNGMQSITVSPDGMSVYAGYQANSSFAGGVAVYNRNTSTGALTFSTNNTGSNNGTQSITVSPDGKSVYAGYQSNSSFAGGSAVYSRNTSTGALTFSGNITNSNNGMYGIAVSPDSKSVYTGYQFNSAYAGGVATHARNISTGALTFSANVTNSNNGMYGIAISADGKSVYTAYQANSSYAGGVAVYNRSRAVSGLGTISILFQNMPSGTTIYYRGYATNSIGIRYSADSTFVTQ